MTNLGGLEILPEWEKQQFSLIQNSNFTDVDRTVPITAIAFTQTEKYYVQVQTVSRGLHYIQLHCFSYTAIHTSLVQIELKFFTVRCQEPAPSNKSPGKVHACKTSCSLYHLFNDWLLANFKF